ncbi:hypothetical protein CP975_29450 [Streptomyces alboniger]|uniref:Uncharacterized protein n=1 Tax=Streptomyces alboniger TaxID=132473 RepID=A0A5J6HVW3_STRAD|nr:hypothetical protein CP975_29450 [Streptomyces alboniger]
MPAEGIGVGSFTGASRVVGGRGAWIGGLIGFLSTRAPRNPPHDRCTWLPHHVLDASWTRSTILVTEKEPLMALIHSTDPDFRVCQLSFDTLLAIQLEAEERSWATRWSSVDPLRSQVKDGDVVLQALMGLGDSKSPSESHS